MHLASLASVVVVAGLTMAGCTEGSSAEAEQGFSAEAVQADCRDPAPLYGERVEMSPTPSYVVLFHDGIDTEAEAARLARVYAFTPTDVFWLIPAFVAGLDDDVRDRVRCEPSVRQVEYSQTDSPPPTNGR